MPFLFVMAFITRSKHLLISWLQSPSTVILESKKIKSVPVSIFSPSICQEVREILSVSLQVFLRDSFSMWSYNFSMSMGGGSPRSSYSAILPLSSFSLYILSPCDNLHTKIVNILYFYIRIWKRIDICIFIPESLCCTLETQYC